MFSEGKSVVMTSISRFFMHSHYVVVQVRVVSVPVTVHSLNQGDVFVLDMREDVYVWCGPNCSRVELRKVCFVQKSAFFVSTKIVRFFPLTVLR